MKLIIKVAFIVEVLLVGLCSCKKNWLDAKPDQKLVVPETIKDFQALLDNIAIFNFGQSYLGELGSDDYYITTSLYLSRAEVYQKVYTWSPGNIFQGASVPDWANYYNAVFYSNNVIEGLAKVSKEQAGEDTWNNLKGAAHFYRAYAFFSLAQLFCKPYTGNSANSDMGIVLRTNSNINAASTRSSVEQTYNQIVDDLSEAKNLLANTPLYNTRPSKQACFALLARVYLLLSDYDKAKNYADSSLQIKNSLIDFNTLSSTTNYPIPDYKSNQEIIFHSVLTNISLLPNDLGSGQVDTTLFKSYLDDDLRKTLFFNTSNGRLFFRGSYNGPSYLFNGLATDEMYLIRAECFARKGDKDACLVDLNTLLKKRKKSATFVNVSANSASEALIKVLEERRKELCFRGIRWADLRRLNLENQFRKTLSKTINNQTFTLPPNDNRYAYPIPDDEVIYSHIANNDR